MNRLSPESVESFRVAGKSAGSTVRSTVSTVTSKAGDGAKVVGGQAWLAAKSIGVFAASFLGGVVRK